jgi:hypothetical protein
LAPHNVAEDGTLYSLEATTYEHELVDRSSLPANFFDPQSLLDPAD